MPLKIFSGFGSFHALSDTTQPLGIFTEISPIGVDRYITKIAGSVLGEGGGQAPLITAVFAANRIAVVNKINPQAALTTFSALGFNGGTPDNNTANALYGASFFFEQINVDHGPNQNAFLTFNIDFDTPLLIPSQSQCFVFCSALELRDNAGAVVAQTFEEFYLTVLGYIGQTKVEGEGQKFDLTGARASK